ncbi:hypothetical protein Tco_0861803, partial [Tanacetum coccineum]
VDPHGFEGIYKDGHGERQSVKVKELQDKRILKAFKLSYQEKYEHVGPKSQDHKMARLQDNVKRLCLVDDLKKFKITFISSERYKNITETLISITDLPDPKLTQSPITHHASTSLNIIPQDTWFRDQHIEIINIIGEPTEGMLTRSMAAKLIVASASECLFVNFLSEIEPKKVFKELKHPGWVNAMQEELN